MIIFCPFRWRGLAARSFRTGTGGTFARATALMITSPPQSNLPHTNPSQQPTPTITIPTHHALPPPSTTNTLTFPTTHAREQCLQH